MELRELFNTAAQIYDDARLSYPDDVIDWITYKTRISKDERLLEIGPGTGQATAKFAERGYSVHCVEMGSNLAELLLMRCKPYKVSVDVDTFENWVPEKGFKTPFIFSASAFHWIDPAVSYKKCYELLSDNGYLVLLWNVASENDIPVVKKAYELLWEYYPDKKNSHKLMAEIINSRKQDIIDSGYFKLEDYLDYKWIPVQSRESFTKGFFSQSAFLSLTEEQQKVLSSKVRELFKLLDDVVSTEFHTTAYIAKKLPK